MMNKVCKHGGKTSLIWRNLDAFVMKISSFWDIHGLEQAWSLTEANLCSGEAPRSRTSKVLETGEEF